MTANVAGLGVVRVAAAAEAKPPTSSPGPAPPAEAVPPAVQLSAPPHGELNDLEETVHHFEEDAADYRQRTRDFIEYRYQKNREAIQASSEAEIEAMEAEQKSRRDEAIAKFERFLKLYPGAEKYTPDAMFRLSELYFERSYETYVAEHQRFERAQQNFDPNSTLPEPEEPTLHYEPTIALMQKLITDFPDYRIVDGAYYLLGFCLAEQGEDDRASETFRELVARRPDSRFAPEVWTRIGEYYFNSNQLDRALQSYTKVLASPESPFYDKALYKLAWTHYRMADAETAPQEFQKAVDTFVQLLDFNEKTKAEGKERGADERSESIQYIAIAYSDEHWGSLTKLLDYLQKLGPKPYSRDILVSMGDVYFDQTRFPEAIAAYRVALTRYPQDAAAPDVQDKIIASLDRSRDFEKAAIEREALTKNYAEGSPWYTKNADDKDAIALATKLTKKAIYSAAIFHHRQAQVSKESKLADVSKTEYSKAASGYGEYLKRYPDDKDAYELRYYYAECLYYAGQYLPAAEQYRAVRDNNTDNKLQEDAAFSTILAYENASRQQEASGKLALAPVLRSSERPAGKKIEPQTLPELKQQTVDATDTLAKLVPKSDKNARTLYKAAEIFYTYDQFDESRKRFQSVLDTYPNSDVAEFAANLIIESYLTEKNYQAVEEFPRLQLTNPALTRRPEFAANMNKFKDGAMFKRADGLAAAGDYEKAADLYLKLIDDNPKYQFADLALNNAAVDYEKVKRYDSASKLYERLVHDYPKSTLADTALFRVGLNAERFFNFSKAVSVYLELVDKYPKSQSRADAIYNAALSLENIQEYERSAEQYQRYCKLFPHRDDAPAVCFRAGAVYEKMDAPKRVIATYETFAKTYRNDAKNRDRVLEAYLKMGKAWDKLKKPEQAHKQYQMAVQFYNRGGGAGADAAKSAPFAAEAQFQLVDAEYAKFQKVKFEGPTKAQKKTLTTKATMLKKVETDYDGILKFKQIEWTLASLFRIGQLYQGFAESLAEAPCPPDVKKQAKRIGASEDEVCDEYRAVLEEKSAAIEDKAVQAYETTVNKAREFQVANAWTKQTLQALNKLRRSEWPLQKDAKQFVDEVAIAPPAPVIVDKQSTAPAPTSAPKPAAAAKPTPATSALESRVGGAT